MSSSIYCVITHGAVLERIHEVETGKSLIGRCDDSAIWLPDSHVSREHAVLSWNGERAVIQDLGSRNGSHISGRRVCGEEIIPDGAEVKIGPYSLRVCFEIGTAIRCFVNEEASTCVDANFDDHVQKLTVAPDLTPGQRRVYDAFVEGLSEKEVALRLNISIHTVHTHAKAIYKSFEISSRTELVRRWAAQQATE